MLGWAMGVWAGWQVSEPLLGTSLRVLHPLWKVSNPGGLLLQPFQHGARCWAAAGPGSCPCGACGCPREKNPSPRDPRGAQLTALLSPGQPASWTPWPRWGWQPTATASATSTASSTRRSGMGGRYGWRCVALAVPWHSQSPWFTSSPSDWGVQTLPLSLEAAAAVIFKI